MNTRMVMVALLVSLAGATGIRAQTTSPAADEPRLLALWKYHIENTNEHAKVIASCDEFRKKSPKSVFLPVCDGLAAWHALQINEPETAIPIFERMAAAEATPLNKAGSTMARRWLTRLDREKVKTALKFLYRKNIAFPATLDAMKTLPAAQQGPFVDRWKQTWNYRLVGFKSPVFKNARDQKYELQSAALGPDSDLKMAMEVPYASKVNLKPGKIISASPGKETIEFSTTDEKAQKSMLSVGSDSGAISFPYMGPSLIILSDGDHWSVIPRSK